MAAVVAWAHNEVGGSSTSSSLCIFSVAQVSPRKAARGTSCSAAYLNAAATTCTTPAT